MRMNAKSRLVGCALLVLAAGLAGCHGQAEPIMLKVAITDSLKSADLLTQMCGRPITQLQANHLRSSGTEDELLTISELQSKTDGIFLDAGKRGVGSATVTYTSKSGPACIGKVSFNFEDVGISKQVTKRVVTHNAAYDLSNFILSK
jgi:hypothetical protein